MGTRIDGECAGQRVRRRGVPCAARCADAVASDLVLPRGERHSCRENTLVLTRGRGRVSGAGRRARGSREARTCSEVGLRSNSRTWRTSGRACLSARGTRLDDETLNAEGYDV